jgi:hypothetical protein
MAPAGGIAENSSSARQNRELMSSINRSIPSKTECTVIGASLAMTVLAWLGCANAAVLTVGGNETYKTIQAAVNAAHDGDTINIRSGVYGCASVGLSGLTIQGVGDGPAKISGEVCQGKGLLVVSGTNTTISNLQFTNAKSSAGNGAGILMQGTNLTVLNSRFYNNQNGILSDFNTKSTITVKNSVFGGNGTCVGSAGCAHAIYAGHIGTLDVEKSTFADTQAGHAIKSRANNTIVIGNKITDGPTGTSSYLIDVPNGGAVTITGNYFEKGPRSSNSTAAIIMGEEGASNPAGAMLIANNTFQNDFSKTHEFIWNRSGNANLIVEGNVLSGNTTVLLKGPGTTGTKAFALPRTLYAADAAASFASTPTRLAASAINAVPEPAALALFGASLLGVGYFIRKRKGSVS